LASAFLIIMNINEIQAFVSIVQVGGVTRAAGRLHRSQPAISRRLKLLEAQLGAPVLEKVRDRIVLTEAGRAFLPFAETVLAAIRDGTEAVRALQAEARGTVSLALTGTLAGTTIVEDLRRFARRHRDVRVELRTANSAEVSDLVRRGEVTLGLRYYDDPSSELVSRTVSAEAMVVACSSEHRLAGRRVGDVRQLAGERWVGFPVGRTRHDTMAHLLQHKLAAAGLAGAEMVAIDSLTAQKRLVEAGFGIALLQESAVQEELRLGTLDLIHVSRLRATVPVSVVHRRAGYLNAAARALLAMIGRPRTRPTRLGRARRK
jgi:DNA-binding transcriptional LysR family regulator